MVSSCCLPAHSEAVTERGTTDVVEFNPKRMIRLILNRDLPGTVSKKLLYREKIPFTFYVRPYLPLKVRKLVITLTDKK